MTNPISFTSETSRFGLPLLFTGQAQKEFFVNEALARLDILVHASVKGMSDEPPASPDGGDCWLVGTDPSGDWAGHADAIASYISGSWLFATPQTGMRVFDKALGQEILFDGEWLRPNNVPAPSGGATQDLEARQAIGELVQALTTAGILA